ncbi:ATP-binding protein [Sabulicella glaciei]|uniref:histidine kinase n=1 Tax=Sabulicella glaciei TaxID=2984948 RepID=A0ABT3P079_9PROT|nr:ATP-binding protein [Roseococcus sp. MDT2-1-1]MCW8087816.1 ATP-binding protein [Roseococcus sp. MDT2-1-1]
MTRTTEMLREHALRAFEAQNAAIVAAALLTGERNWSEIRDAADLHEALLNLDRAAPATVGIALIDPEGKLALTSRVALPTPAVDLSGRDYVHAHQDSEAGSKGIMEGGTFVGAVSEGAVTGRPVFRLSRARLGAARQPDGGVVSTAFFPAYFEEFWRGIIETERDVVLLLRHDGAVLARHPAPAAPVGLSVPSGTLLQLIQGQEAKRDGPGRLRLEAGEAERLVVVRGLGDFPVSVAYALNASVQWRNWAARLPAPALLAGLATILLMFLTWRAQREAGQARQEAERRAEMEEQLRRSEARTAFSQLAAGVAHDFGNAAQVVMAGAHRIERSVEDPARVREAVARVVGAAERAAGLAARMISFARRGAPEGNTASIQPVDPSAILSELVELLSSTLGHGVTTRYQSGQPRPPRVNVDRGELESAVINLCLNARDAMPDGGEVLVLSQGDAVAQAEGHPAGLAPGAYARIEVRDKGMGMDEATRARAGDPFFTTKGEKGTGLGLSMVRGFAVRADGGLHVSSHPGRGTTVTLWLPAVRPERL